MQIPDANTTADVELWRTDIRARFADMDAQRHINNLAYLGYMQECRAQWLLSLELENTCQTVVVNSWIEYLQELVYPTTVTVIMTASGPGRSSLMTHYEIWANSGEQYLAARGDAKIVFIDANKRKSVPIPEAVRKKF